MERSEDADFTLERGFVATLRWLVAEGDARGVRRIAVELRALREAITTLDETRVARDEYARHAAELDRELQAALAVLGPGTAVHGNGTLVQRLAKLRERLAADTESRHQLTLERDAWRAMCTLLTQTRARVHELLEDTEKQRDGLSTALDAMRDRVAVLSAMHDDAQAEGERSRGELAEMRAQLAKWSGAVDKALAELARQAREIARPG
jgi:chromosome segregation ATPase